MRRAPHVQMVYPRMLFGGAEESIVQLLRAFPSTHMIVTHTEGQRAEDARAAAGRYTLLEEPRLQNLIQQLRLGDVAHLHTINEDPRPQLAALLAGVEVIVQTLHNDTVPDTCQLVDHNIVLADSMLDVVDTPSRASVVPCAIECDAELSPFDPWFKRGRPITLVECRRPDKPLCYSLLDVVQAGALDGLDFRIVQIGFDEPSDDPRVMSVGVQTDPRPWIASADFLFCGHDNDTFGRAPLEALALGTLPVVTPLPVFDTNLGDCDAVEILSSRVVEVAARELRARIDVLTGGSRYEELRREGFDLVRSRFPRKAMADKTWSVYEHWLGVPDRPMRSFGPGDVTETQLPEFCEMVEALCCHGNAAVLRGWEKLDAGMLGVLSWVWARHGCKSNEHALHWLQRSAACLGTRPVIENEIACVAAKMGRLDYAVEHYELSLSLDDGVCTSHFGRIDALVRLGDTAGALVAAEQFAVALPESRVALQTLEMVDAAIRSRPTPMLG